MTIIDRLVQPLVRAYEPPDDIPLRADGIMGVGIALNSDGSPSPMSSAVANRCAALYMNNIASAILLAGGYRQNFVTEAEAMRTVAIAAGVPAGVIHLETCSYRTHLNAALTLPIVQRLGWRTIVLVTQHVHSRRALAIFKRTFGERYQFGLAKAYSEYTRLPQARLTSEARFFLTWELPCFALAKLRRWG